MIGFRVSTRSGSALCDAAGIGIKRLYSTSRSLHALSLYLDFIPLAANSKPTESWLLFTSSEIIIERLSRSPTKIEDISEHLRNRSKRIERVGLGTRNRTRTRTSTSRPVRVLRLHVTLTQSL